MTAKVKSTNSKKGKEITLQTAQSHLSNRIHSRGRKMMSSAKAE